MSQFLIYYRIAPDLYGNIVFRVARVCDCLSLSEVEAARFDVRLNNELDRETAVIICNIMRVDPLPEANRRP